MCDFNVAVQLAGDVGYRTLTPAGFRRAAQGGEHARI